MGEGRVGVEELAVFFELDVERWGHFSVLFLPSFRPSWALMASTGGERHLDGRP
jgi:hypothetical protein